MNDVTSIQPYVYIFMVLVSGVLAVALACSTSTLAGKGWLIASAVITLISRPSHYLIIFLDSLAPDSIDPLSWMNLLNLLPLFGTACFALFLFANWSRSRMQINVWPLLFSFSGRIPRSAFWILLCVFFPLGTLVGFAPFVTYPEGIVDADAAWLPNRIIWTVYGIWLILSVWIAFALYAKRWHDCAKSGWMSLVLFVPVIGPLWLLGHLGFVRGTAGPNPYGDNPLRV
jgi:uncharacterized membrane protein YhaH (DUF805 family)